MGNMASGIRQSRGLIRFGIKPVLWLVLGYGALDLLVGVLTDKLGPDPVETLLHTSGLWAVNSMVATLLVTPLSRILNWPLLIQTRRLCGLFVFFYASLHLWIYIQYILFFSIFL